MQADHPPPSSRPPGKRPPVGPPPATTTGGSELQRESSGSIAGTPRAPVPKSRPPPINDQSTPTNSTNGSETPSSASNGGRRFPPPPRHPPKSAASPREEGNEGNATPTNATTKKPPPPPKPKTSTTTSERAEGEPAKAERQDSLQTVSEPAKAENQVEQTSMQSKAAEPAKSESTDSQPSSQTTVVEPAKTENAEGSTEPVKVETQDAAASSNATVEPSEGGDSKSQGDSSASAAPSPAENTENRASSKPSEEPATSANTESQPSSQTTAAEAQSTGSQGSSQAPIEPTNGGGAERQASSPAVAEPESAEAKTGEPAKAATADSQASTEATPAEPLKMEPRNDGHRASNPLQDLEHSEESERASIQEEESKIHAELWDQCQDNRRTVAVRRSQKERQQQDFAAEQECLFWDENAARRMWSESWMTELNLSVLSHDEGRDRILLATFEYDERTLIEGQHKVVSIQREVLALTHIQSNEWERRNPILDAEHNEFQWIQALHAAQAEEHIARLQLVSNEGEARTGLAEYFATGRQTLQTVKQKENEWRALYDSLSLGLFKTQLEETHRRSVIHEAQAAEAQLLGVTPIELRARLTLTTENEENRRDMRERMIGDEAILQKRLLGTHREGSVDEAVQVEIILEEKDSDKPAVSLARQRYEGRGPMRTPQLVIHQQLFATSVYPATTYARQLRSPPQDDGHPSAPPIQTATGGAGPFLIQAKIFSPRVTQRDTGAYALPVSSRIHSTAMEADCIRNHRDYSSRIRDRPQKDFDASAVGVGSNLKFQFDSVSRQGRLSPRSSALYSPRLVSTAAEPVELDAPVLRQSFASYGARGHNRPDLSDAMTPRGYSTPGYSARSSPRARPAETPSTRIPSRIREEVVSIQQGRWDPMDTRDSPIFRAALSRMDPQPPKLCSMWVEENY